MEIVQAVDGRGGEVRSANFELCERRCQDFWFFPLVVKSFFPNQPTSTGSTKRNNNGRPCRHH